MLFSYPKKLRLKNREQIQHAFYKAKKISCRKFSFFFKPNNLNYPRLGLIIGKKAIQHAVQRNRFKRIVKESFRLQQHDLNGLDLIFVAYKGLDKISNEDFKQCLEKNLPRKK